MITIFDVIDGQIKNLHEESWKHPNERAKYKFAIEKLEALKVEIRRQRPSFANVND